MTPDRSPTDLHREARRRVKMKLGLATHLLVYLLVNAGLAMIDALHDGTRWSICPLMGWGLGLAIHALVVTLRLGLDGWAGGMVEREARRLEARRH